MWINISISLCTDLSSIALNVHCFHLSIAQMIMQNRQVSSSPMRSPSHGAPVPGGMGSPQRNLQSPHNQLQSPHSQMQSPHSQLASPQQQMASPLGQQQQASGGQLPSPQHSAQQMGMISTSAVQQQHQQQMVAPGGHLQLPIGVQGALQQQSQQQSGMQPQQQVSGGKTKNTYIGRLLFTIKYKKKTLFVG